MSACAAATGAMQAEWTDVLAGLRTCLRERLAGTRSRFALPVLPRPLRLLAERFGLSDFEAATIAVCAAIEWDATVAADCATLQGDSARLGLTHALAVELIEGGHWAVLAPVGKLRRWRLVDLAPGTPIATARLSVDERILHYLLDVSFLDPRLDGLVRPVAAPDFPSTELSRQIADSWKRADQISACPVVEFPPHSLRDPLQVAAAVCASLRLRLHRIDARAIPPSSMECEALARLWEREALLVNGALMIDGEDLEPADAALRVVPFLNSLQGVVFYVGVLPRLERAQLRVCHPAPDEALSAEAWREELGPAGARLNGHLDPVRAQFRLRPAALRRAAARTQGRTDAEVAASLWDACRIEARGDLDGLAQRVEARASWRDLVLPPAQLATLRTLVLHVRQRYRVYNEWGFANQSARGLGIGALFSGGSGTGKTLAAEVLATELRLDLYRIDLASLVSKYIGETEKNLRRVFDAAEAGGALLLFDEADALFGARSEVRDSHDRYANIEVAYLLQRIETYRGLAILTTNLKRSIDAAFLRRLRFVVHFPLPDAAARREIWARVFPAQTPQGAIGVERLARLNLTGGHIRNIAVNAAFLAADAGEPVGMRHLLSATEAEYGKLEKPLPRSDVGDWL
jgi:ATPase family protein associated with various cellular activities (AAA)/winged helix domain-containing protein